MLLKKTGSSYKISCAVTPLYGKESDFESPWAIINEHLRKFKIPLMEPRILL